MWAEKLPGNRTADLLQIFLFFIQPWGIRNDLESIRECFSFGKIRNLEKNITLDYSKVLQFPVFRSRPEVENMTMHSFRVNSISTKFHPNQPTGDAHHVTKTSCFLAQKFWGISWHLPDLYSGIPCSKEFKGAWKSKLQIIQNHSWVPREIFQVLLKSICHFEIISKRVRYP